MVVQIEQHKVGINQRQRELETLRKQIDTITIGTHTYHMRVFTMNEACLPTRQIY